MKPTRFRQFSKNTPLSLLGTTALGIALAFSATEAQAIAVDSELVLLVDIVQPEMNNGMFNQLKNSFASTFTSSQFLNAIQSGVTGRIAVSVIFYGGAATQVTAVPWMSIGSLSDAQTFANAIQSANRPTTLAYSNPATALTAAANAFGTETGGSSNGFESAVQIINVTSSGIPSNSMAVATNNSSNNALAAGVDLINSVAHGSYANSINSFYAANVIGSTMSGVNATSSIAANNGALPSSISAALTSSVQNGAAASITAVPEPSSLMALLPAGLLIFRRRR